METLPQYLQYGEEVTVPSKSLIFSPNERPGEKPIMYVIAGLVKVEYAFGGTRLPLYVTPDTLFGLVEPLAESDRLCSALTLEKTILYRWALKDFFIAAGVSWELALMATTAMTHELRILNAEFGERIEATQGSGR